MGDLSQSERLTFRQLRWWSPARVALTATYVLWLVPLLLGTAAGVTGEGSIDFWWVFLTLVIPFSVPLTVLTWLVAVLWTVVTARWRRSRRAVASES